MNGQKKNIDIRVILDQLNIPMEKFEQWQASQSMDESSSIKNHLDSWNFTSSFLFREMAKPECRSSHMNQA